MDQRGLLSGRKGTGCLLPWRLARLCAATVAGWFEVGSDVLRSNSMRVSKRKPRTRSNPPGKHRKHDKKHKKDDDDDKKPATCRDIKDRKACRKSDKVCSWCEGSWTPAMCVEEVRGRGAGCGAGTGPCG